jgi:hypothetical protein
MTARRKLPRAPAPTEYQEHIRFARWLDAKRLLWCHVPNESSGPVQWRVKRKRMGVRPGVPDFLIFGTIHTGPIAVEMKRVRGGRLSDTQQDWLDELANHGWITIVAKGADDAVAQLERIGL